MKIQLVVWTLSLALVEILGKKHEEKKENSRQLIKDIRLGLAAIIDPSAKECYITALHSLKQNMPDIKRSMGMFPKRFLSRRNSADDKRPLFMKKLTVKEVGAKIAAYCAGYELILTTVPISVDFHHPKILAGREKRAVINSFWGCDMASNSVPKECKRSGGTLAALCRFWNGASKTCEYEITCNTVSVNGGIGANCPGVSHFRHMQCCNFICL